MTVNRERSAVPAGRHRKQPAPWPAHRTELTGLLIGLACGLLVALTWLAVRGGPGAAGQPGAPGPVTIDSQAGSGGGPDPAALDAQWAAYSDHSTCADWACGDGVSAVALSSKQIAWFFSDTYLGDIYHLVIITGSGPTRMPVCWPAQIELVTVIV